MAGANPEEIVFLERQYRSAQQDVERFSERLEQTQRQLADATALRDAAKLLLDRLGGSTSERSDRTPVTATSNIFVGMRIRDAIESIMRSAVGPMKASDVVEELERGGMVLTADKPAATVTSTLSRENELYERVGTGLYRLRGDAPAPGHGHAEAGEKESDVSGEAAHYLPEPSMQETAGASEN